MSNFKEVKVQFYDGFLLKLVNMVIGQPWLAGLFNDRVNYTSRMRLALTCSHAGQPGQSGQRRMSALPVEAQVVDHGFPRPDTIIATPSLRVVTRVHPRVGNNTSVEVWVLRKCG